MFLKGGHGTQCLVALTATAYGFSHHLQWVFLFTPLKILLAGQCITMALCFPVYCCLFTKSNVFPPCSCSVAKLRGHQHALCPNSVRNTCKENLKHGKSSFKSFHTTHNEFVIRWCYLFWRRTDLRRDVSVWTKACATEVSSLPYLLV